MYENERKATATGRILCKSVVPRCRYNGCTICVACFASPQVDRPFFQLGVMVHKAVYIDLHLTVDSLIMNSLGEFN